GGIVLAAGGIVLAAGGIVLAAGGIVLAAGGVVLVLLNFYMWLVVLEFLAGVAVLVKQSRLNFISHKLQIFCSL
ncbi:hypothetical protein Bpfe_029448, partial [Biomphalaria pfeifferi]